MSDASPVGQQRIAPAHSRGFFVSRRLPLRLDTVDPVLIPGTLTVAAYFAAMLPAVATTPVAVETIQRLRNTTNSTIL